MYSFNTGFSRVVDGSISNAACFQNFDAFLRLASQIVELPEFDGFRGASFGAGWLQSCKLSIRAEGALEGAAISFIFFHHTEGTSNNTVRAAVAYVRLNEDRPKL